MVLVVDGKGVVTSIHTRLIDQESTSRVTITGDVRVEPEIISYVNDTILGIVETISQVLNQGKSFFEIVIKNIDATAIHNMGLAVTGRSADAAFFLSMFSACLQLPIRQDSVFTGQIITQEGYLSPVSEIPKKIEAAAKDRRIQRFIYSELGQDNSLRTLAPDADKKIRQALRVFSDHVKPTPVGDINELARVAVSEEDVCRASLRSGFFSIPKPTDADQTPVGLLAGYLLDSNDSRFWKFLVRHLLEQQLDDAKDLLKIYIDYHICLASYPQGFGQRLQQLLISIPPRVRRKRGFAPLITMKSYIEIAQYAQKENHQDLKTLHETIFDQTRPSSVFSSKATSPDKSQSDTLLQHFLVEPSPEHLAREVLISIDNGRASYTVDRVTVETYEEFLESIASFYAHLLRYKDQVSGVVNTRHVGPDALDLLKRTFSNYGDEKAAYVEATSGAQGGLRYIFDLMTQRLKAEERDKYVRMVLKTAIDPLDFETKTTVIQVLMNQLGSALPDDIRSQPPEKFATNYDIIIEAYAKSLEKLIETIKLL